MFAITHPKILPCFAKTEAEDAKIPERIEKIIVSKKNFI